MTKEQFLKQLESTLNGLPQAEKRDIISDYQEHFAAGLESGRSESELAESLGNPKALGKQLRANYHIKKAENKISAGEIFRAVLATAGLGFFNLVFIAFPFFGALFFLLFLIGGGVGAFATGVVGFFTSVVAIISPATIDRYIYFGIQPAAGFFLSIALAGFSILFLIGCWYLCKWFYQLTVSYLRLNINIIKGEKETK